MVELPRRRRRTNPRQTFRGVVCENCRTTGIAVGGSVASLPLIILLTCPRCGHQTTSRKTDIQTLEAQSLQ
jgi:ribosomal protein S27E